MELTQEHPPLAISRRTFVVGLILIWLAVVAAQVIVFQYSVVSTRDACGVYLPLAKAAAEGDWAHAQSPMFPPAYPVLCGLVSRALPFAQYPQELAGKLINALLLHAILACVVVICLKLWSRRVALAATGLTGLNPAMLQMSVNVWLEPTLAALLMAIVTVLILTREKISWPAVALVGVLSGLAGLVRSEGILVPFATMACLLICHLRRNRQAAMRTAAACAAVLVIVACVWAPRVKYVYAQSGYAMLDIRAATMLGAEDEVDPQLWQAPLEVEDKGPTIGAVNVTPWRDTATVEGQTAKWMRDSLRGLATGWSVLGVIFGIYALVRRSPLAKQSRAVAVLCVFIAMQLAATGVTLFWMRRYMAVVSPMVAILAGVGLVAMTEQVRMRGLRNGFGWWNAWSDRLWPQLAMLAGIFAVYVAFCVMKPLTAHSEQRYAGEEILRRMGAGQRVLSCAGNVAYYANGRWVKVPSYTREQFSNATLAAMIRESGATAVFLDKERRWCPELAQGLAAGKYREAVVFSWKWPPNRKDKDDTVTALDGARLLAEFARDGQQAATTQERND